MKRMPVRRSAPLISGMAAVWLIQVALAGCSRRGEGVGRPHDLLKLEIGEASLVVEVACDEPSRALGLMNRESLPETHGMLFVFRTLEKQNFWMKNTLIPLSIAFISDDGEILQIEHMKPKDLRGTGSKHRVRYALEVNKGWFERHGIGTGARIQDFQEKIRRFNPS